MQSNQHLPNGGLRSASTTSNLSVNSSTTSITRVALGPIQMMNMNKQSSAKDHIHTQCIDLRRRLMEVEGMKPYLDLAYAASEQLAEQQALALSQLLQEKGPNDFRTSTSSAGFSMHSDSSSLNSGSINGSKSYLNCIFTFTAGVLPANTSVDPVTHMWKLFQQGAPLCLIYNSVVPDHQLPVVGSDDLRICKKSVYDFLIAVKTHLKFDDDLMFTVSNVFLDSTHDLIKVFKVVKKVFELKPSRSASLSDVSQLSMSDLSLNDDRSKVFNEIITTERKYVQDLELMLQYKNELEQAEIISSEQIHTLFPNISEILDFQRRFLNGLECNINVRSKYQRIGSAFIHAASGPFKAYEPWTIGQLAAIDLINKETASLKKSSSVLDPGFELQSYIIKPIQRLCKYPLLIKELLRASPSLEEGQQASFPQNELFLAHSAMKEVANHVNEAQRRSENIRHAQNLHNRVSNWRGFNLKDQGELLHHGLVGVRDSDTEKDYTAYLFERIIFFFVQSNRDGGREKEKKKRELLTSRKKSSSSVASASTTNLLESLDKSRDNSQLELKGRVYILEIYIVNASNQNGYTLLISWSGKRESGSFTLRFRNEETRNQWESCLRQLKSLEMNNQINRKLRDSRGSQATNDSSIYDVATAYANQSPVSVSNGTSAHESTSTRSSNGSSYHRHHSSSSTFSMMRPSKKSNNDVSRMSSNGTRIISGGSEYPPPVTIEIKLLYNQVEIPDPLIVLSSIHFGELYLKISSKIAASNKVEDDIMVNKLKYKDEDGDFVVMDSSDDWVLAIDMVEEFAKSSQDGLRSLTIWVS